MAKAKKDSEAKRSPVNVRWATGEAVEALKRLEFLTGYQRFLAEARQHKAECGTASAAFEREVLDQARVAEAHGRALLASALRVTKHLKNAGLVDHALKSWTAMVKKEGKVKPETVLNRALKNKTVKGMLEDAGISEATCAQMVEAVAATGQNHRIKGKRLVVRSGRHNREIVLKRRAPPGRPRTLDDLLFGNQFDAVVDVFDDPKALVADVVPMPPDHVGRVEAMEPLETLLASAALASQELTRHRRKLEDVGLTVHDGDDPITITLIVIGAVAAVGLLIGGTIVLLCLAEVIGDDETCTIGEILLSFGLVLLIGAIDCLVEGCRFVIRIIVEGMHLDIVDTEVEGQL